MPKPKVDDDDFISLWRELGPHKLQRKLGMTLSGVYRRRRNLELRYKINLAGPDDPRNTRENIVFSHPQRAPIEVKNGHVIVGSDAHYWPGDPSPAHRGVVHFIKELRPKAFILNGDAIDASTISRHPPIGWENRPTVAEEIEVCQDRLHEIRSAIPRGAPAIWTLGNHDARFETRLATVAPEYAKVHGVHLQDHFPHWKPAWSAWINDSVVVKHRFKGGIHAPHNNTMWAGRSIITGHLHSAKVVPFDDYDGTRYGVDTGCIADPWHKAFIDYTEDNPKNWRAGFAVLTFIDGRLLQPELALVWDADHIQFRGELIKV